MWDEIKIQKLKTYINDLKPTFAGKFLYYCLPIRKKIVLDNMKRVFNTILSETEIKKLAISFYSHLFTTFKEVLLMPFMSKKRLKLKGIIKNHQHLLEVVNKNLKGAILITGHFGNAEMAPIFTFLNFHEHRGHFYIIRKNISNKFIEKLIFKRWRKVGIEIILKNNALDKVCSVLESQNVVTFVMDQHASIQSKDGILVDFLGTKVATFKSLAIIARAMQVPVLPTRAYRRSDGKHVVEFFPPLPWLKDEDSKEEIKKNTRQYNEWLEKFVLDYPDQWFWLHRRWKNT